jgi:hypothetical protein
VGSRPSHPRPAFQTDLEEMLETSRHMRANTGSPVVQHKLKRLIPAQLYRVLKTGATEPRTLPIDDLLSTTLLGELGACELFRNLCRVSVGNGDRK